tara:strand:+ start:409 stop:618 length:210 start_codon:yes stop_codon:yes gene_type:complete
MKKIVHREPKTERYRLEKISRLEIQNKYPDKMIDARVEGGRLVLILDTCRIKFDERIPQKGGDKYGAIH